VRPNNGGAVFLCAASFGAPFSFGGAGVACENCEKMQRITDEAVENSIDANQSVQKLRRKLEGMTNFARELVTENRKWRELKVGKGEVH
jgi:hypothetical protein